jgi:hypothetical protein
VLSPEVVGDIRQSPQRKSEGGMRIDRTLSLRDVADLLELDRIRLFRLGRILYLTPGDQCIPPSVIAKAKLETESERRYAVVRTWLLESYRPAKSSPDKPNAADREATT